MCARPSHRLWIVLLPFLAAAGTLAFAGEAGQLVGTVLDESGNAVAGARITLKGAGAFGTQSLIADAEGRYRVIALNNGRPLDIRVEADGKIPVEYRGVQVRADRITHLDVRLRGRDDHDVLVLLDDRVPYHFLALDGARSTLPGDIHVLRVREASPSQRREVLTALEQRPSAVLAIGEAAAEAARGLARDVPVVHTMVPDPHPGDFASDILCGLPMSGSLERQVERLTALDPGMKRIATVYDPSHLSNAVARFRRAAEAAGLALVAQDIHDPADLLRALDDLAQEEFEAFVVLMDPELYTARNFAIVRRFAEERDVVLVVPDSSMAATAKSFTFGPGFWESGAIAGNLVRQIVEGSLQPGDIGMVEAAEGTFAPGGRARAPRILWEPAPGGEPPLVGAVGTEPTDQDPGSDGSRHR